MLVTLFLLQALSLCNSHIVKSNHESGVGRYESKLSIILEFKTAKKEEDIKAVANTALAQIESRKYATELQQMGISKINIETGDGF